MGTCMYIYVVRDISMKNVMSNATFGRRMLVQIGMQKLCIKGQYKIKLPSGFRSHDDRNSDCSVIVQRYFRR